MTAPMAKSFFFSGLQGLKTAGSKVAAVFTPLFSS
jgi:hypothetical protein